MEYLLALSLILKMLERLLLFWHLLLLKVALIELCYTLTISTFSLGLCCYCFPASGDEMDWPDHLLPQICPDSHSNVNLCLVFIWRLIYSILSLLGRGWFISGVYHLLGATHASMCQNNFLWCTGYFKYCQGTCVSWYSLGFCGAFTFGSWCLPVVHFVC